MQFPTQTHTDDSIPTHEFETEMTEIAETQVSGRVDFN